MADSTDDIPKLFDGIDSDCNSDEGSSTEIVAKVPRCYRLRLGSKVGPQLITGQSGTFASDSELIQSASATDLVKMLPSNDAEPQLVKFCLATDENNLSPRLEGYLLSGHENPTFTLTQSEADLAKKYFESGRNSSLDVFTISDSATPVSASVDQLIHAKGVKKTTVDGCFLTKIKASLHRHRENETSLMIALQVILPFFIAGFGTVGAGLLLDNVQHWQVFKEVSEILILVPALLGLKGNLEMTSASRLSTMVNLGYINLREPKYIVANLSLVQIQAAVVGFLASVFATFLAYVAEKKFNLVNATVLCASSITTSALASLILDSALVGVIIASHKYHINPDNVATPVAASFGDLITLGLLAGTGTFFNTYKDTHLWISIGAIVLFVLLLPLWLFLCIKIKYAKQVLKTGWPPIIISMLISSGGGFILDISTKMFHTLAAFQPVVNGIGGNLVAIQASRLATYMHDKAVPGTMSTLFPTLIPNPIRVFFGKRNVHARAARVLLALVIPGHLIFMSIIYAMKQPEVQMTAPFVFGYIIAGFVQVVLLLYICVLLSNILWRWKMNPDSCSIPILTALGDFFGTGLLSLTYLTIRKMNDPNALVAPN